MTFDVLILGQGLAGTALAWQLHWRGNRVGILDREAAVTSSRVAAGLVTPITGQRLAKSWRLDDLWPAALAFYERVEAETQTCFVYRRPNVRLFHDAEERALFEKRRASFGDWASADPDVNADWFAAPHGACAMPSLQLATERYLDASRDYFLNRGAYFQANIDLTCDLDGAAIPRLGLRAERLVFCQGHDGAANPHFPDIRFGGAKGEILTLRIPGLAEERIVNRGVWLLPLGEEIFRAGSTFEHVALDCHPTVRGREEICARLREFLRLPFEVIEHRAAIRPVIDAGKPMLGLRGCFGFFNGLGSKGTLLAPYFANQLAAALLGKEQIERAVRPPNERELWKGSLTQQSHAAVREVLHAGDIAIDATAGNGHDTRFLAEQVGPTGLVFAFEIQDDARERLRTSMPGSVILAGDHAELASVIPAQHRGRVAAAMFNLGYRPGSDKAITTRPETTLAAIRAALDFLRPGGILTVVAYTGHSGGAEEAAAVARLLADYSPAIIESERGKAPGPRLFVVHKQTD